jgi:GNAT superfamily N-acetyltransferase
VTGAVSIRLACEADAGQVAEVKAIGWDTAYRGLVPDDIVERFTDLAVQTEVVRTAIVRADALVLVAEREGRIVGVALSELGPEPFLDALHVRPDERSGGVGAALLRRTAHELMARGHDTMTLHIVAGNDRAGSFYERHGAHRTGTVPADWGDGRVLELGYRWDDLRPAFGPTAGG